MKNHLSIIVVIMFISFNQTFAQNGMNRSIGQTKTTETKKVKVGAFGEIIEMKNDNLKNKLYFHAAKEITKETGFFIQLISTQEILEKENEIFQDFGSVLVERTLNPKYCYFIGGFETRVAANTFVSKVILDRYPNAVVVEFENGQRK